MWLQFRAIWWAQFRSMRNHLPRTSMGGIISGALAVLWYGMYAAFGIALATVLPHASLAKIEKALPVSLLAVFLFWQFVPLFTLSTGWSLDLRKLQTFPIRNRALFTIETILRLSTAPEMILVLLGGMVGLLRHPQIPALRPLWLLLYIPLNLFLSLAVRDALRQVFRKNRLRELLGVLILGLGLLPSFLLTATPQDHTRRHLFEVGGAAGTPWHELAALSLKPWAPASAAVIFLWCIAVYALARWQFGRTLSLEQEVPPEVALSKMSSGAARRRGVNLLNRAFPDPLAALMQKELRSLRRIPRFRVIFGMACVFGALLFAQIVHRDVQGFGSDNFLPLVNVYGFLLLGEVLLWNTFGFEGWATQLYFLAPIRFQTVLLAKNLVSVLFMALQTIVVFLIVVALRFPMSTWAITKEVAVSAVVAIFFLAAGNLTSVILPRRVDPNQTFRKQSSGIVQLWLLISSLGICALLSLAFLARYAFNTNWAFLSVLVVEFCIGCLIYRITMESAVARAARNRERLLETLSASASPISS